MATIDLMDQFSHLGEGGIRNNGTLDAEVMFQPALRTMRTDFIQVKAGDSIVYKNMSGMSSIWNILSFYTGDAQDFYVSGIAGQTTPQSGVWTAAQDGYVRLFGSFPSGDNISVTMTDLAPDVEDYLSQYNAMNYRFLPNSIPKIVAHIQEYLVDHPIADSTTLQAVIDAAFESYMEEIQQTADDYIAEAVPQAAAAAVDAAASPALAEITAKTAEAAESARQAGLSQQSAEMSEENALTYRNQAQQIKNSIVAEVSASVLAAQEQATLAQESAQAADQSADTAEQYVAQARAHAEAAADQAQTASGYASDAQGYMQDASGFAQNASDFADNAAQSAATFSTDPTLTISGKAADAKATGDEISALKSALVPVVQLLTTNLPALNKTNRTITFKNRTYICFGDYIRTISRDTVVDIPAESDDNWYVLFIDKTTGEFSFVSTNRVNSTNLTNKGYLGQINVKYWYISFPFNITIDEVVQWVNSDYFNNNAVIYSGSQSLSTSQKQNVRNNIGAVDSEFVNSEIIKVVPVAQLLYQPGKAPIIDTVNRTLTIRARSFLIYSNKVYSISSNTIIDIPEESDNNWYALYMKRDTKVFSFIGISNINSTDLSNQVYLGQINVRYWYISFPFKVLINGKENYTGNIQGKYSCLIEKIYKSKYINHIGVGSHTGIGGYAPSQSIFDIQRAKRVGFNFIELNTERTSDNEYIVLHGNNGKFGENVYSLDSTDISNVDVSSKTLTWIKANVRFINTNARYNVAPLTLEDALLACKKEGLIPLVQYRNRNDIVTLCNNVMGDDSLYMLATYEFERPESFNGVCISWFNTITDINDILAFARNVGHPFICGIQTYNSAYNNYTESEWKTLVDQIHQAGFLCSFTGAYESVQRNIMFEKIGFDINTSGWQVPIRSNQNLYVVDCGTDFSEFTGINSGDVNNGIASIASGTTITPDIQTKPVYIGTGKLTIKFNGTISISMGRKINYVELTSDGNEPVTLSTIFLDETATFSITTQTNVILYELDFSASIV